MLGTMFIPAKRIVLAASLFLAADAPGQSYDLKANWSNAQNPNGPWVYREGTNALPAVMGWQGAPWDVAQPGWARGTQSPGAFVPFWFKSNGAEGFSNGWEVGDVVVHTTGGPEGGANGAANVVWNSPLDGSITLTGGVWAGREIGRAQRFTLSHNSLRLSTGVMATGDSYNRIYPFTFAGGASSGQVLMNRDVARGDTIKIEAAPAVAGGPGDFVGMNLNIIVCIGVVQDPRHALMCPGGNAALTMQARTSYGTISYRWRRAGVPLLEGGRFHGVFAPTLTITGVIASDAAVYDCVVGSVCSTIASRSATLTICRADFDCSGTLNALDLFEFMNGWFAADPRADFNGINGTDPQDIFDFVGAWFVGC